MRPPITGNTHQVYDPLTAAKAARAKQRHICGSVGIWGVHAAGLVGLVNSWALSLAAHCSAFRWVVGRGLWFWAEKLSISYYSPFHMSLTLSHSVLEMSFLDDSDTRGRSRG